MTYKEENTYTYGKHRFGFAAWAAGRAVKDRKLSFEVKDAQEILKEVGFCEIAEKGIATFPEYEDFDKWHHMQREAIWEKANERQQAKKPGKEFSHGHAAKLINVFLKALMPPNLEDISADHQIKWYAVHPPLDRTMLKNMVECGVGSETFWCSLPGTDGPAWTQFESCHYEGVIDTIREHERARRDLGKNDPVPLWQIERYWPGHQ